MGVLLTPITVRHPTSLEALRRRTIAVDGNLELYQFLSIMRTRDGQPLQDSKGRITSHLNGLAFRTTRLLADYDIRPLFVFDGRPPDLKRKEIQKRIEAREKSQREYNAAVAAGDTATAWSKAVMTSRLTRTMVEEAKTLLTLIGIPWIQAPSEGEAQASQLSREGQTWAAGSKDYDSLLPELLDLDENLRALGLTREELIDAAILIGTDFNPGVRGVGPKTAVRLLREYHSLSSLPSDVRQSLPDNVDAIREFFLHPPVAPIDQIVPGALDPEGLRKFLCDERDFNATRVESLVQRLSKRRLIRPRLDDFSEPRETIK